MNLKTGMLLSAVVLFFVSCGSKKETTTDVATHNEKVKIKIEQVHEQTVPQLFEYTAIVEADVSNSIASTSPGRIEKIHVEVGDKVHAGQLLVQMDESNLVKAKANLDILEVTFNRVDALYKEGGISKSDWDRQKTELDVARATYQDLLKNTRLLSPISGIVTARNNDNGDLYAGNPVTLPILQVQKITPVKMLINVSEMQFTKIKRGMEVSIKIEALSNQEFTGKVSLIYPTIDANTHTFPVEIMLPNTKGDVRPGMYAKVTVNMGTEKRVVVPDIAIVKQQGSGDRYVYVYKDGKVSYNKVEIGQRINNNYELISGVEDGDFVAVTSQSRLNNGIEVEIAK
ncbi:MAG: efflux RND transporter periplasmic adaptor subunit [Bacteroidales bacterium]|jgi:RND family efflux transporter MFP subunit|nr:efflux RND transporter periplasmic adaptor subunit [Bacteroidales bacterium]